MKIQKKNTQKTFFFQQQTSKKNSVSAIIQTHHIKGLQPFLKLSATSRVLVIIISSGTFTLRHSSYHRCCIHMNITASVTDS